MTEIYMNMTERTQFEIAYDEVKQKNPSYGDYQCISAAYDLLVKKLKISRDIDAHARQAIYGPDKKLIGYLKDRTRSSAVRARGAMYAYGHETRREFTVYDVNGKTLSVNRYKKDTLDDLVRSVYSDKSRLLKKENHVSFLLLKRIIKEAVL